MKKDTIEISGDTKLSSRECGPCAGREGRLKPAAIKQLEMIFKFPDFQQALDLGV